MRPASARDRQGTTVNGLELSSALLICEALDARDASVIAMWFTRE
ncbi:hypothetical protein [Streptomyces sp. NBC_00316]|nr:hypothetical protein [Streptomyces sp. NBC_00316]